MKQILPFTNGSDWQTNQHLGTTSYRDEWAHLKSDKNVLLSVEEFVSLVSYIFLPNQVTFGVIWLNSGLTSLKCRFSKKKVLEIKVFKAAAFAWFVYFLENLEVKVFKENMLFLLFIEEYYGIFFPQVPNHVKTLTQEKNEVF